MHYLLFIRYLSCNNLENVCLINLIIAVDLFHIVALISLLLS